MKLEAHPEKELIVNLIMQAFSDFKDLIQKELPKKEHCIQAGFGCGLVIEAQNLLKFFYEPDRMEEWIHLAKLEIDPESIRWEITKQITTNYGTQEAWLSKVRETQNLWNDHFKEINRLQKARSMSLKEKKAVSSKKLSTSQQSEKEGL